MLRKRIEKLTIKGFKSIKELIAFLLGDINVAVGANGAGTAWM